MTRLLAPESKNSFIDLNFLFMLKAELRHLTPKRLKLGSLIGKVKVLVSNERAV